MEHSTGQDPMK